MFSRIKSSQGARVVKEAFLVKVASARHCCRRTGNVPLAEGAKHQVRAWWL